MANARTEFILIPRLDSNFSAHTLNTFIFDCKNVVTVSISFYRKDLLTELSFWTNNIFIVSQQFHQYKNHGPDEMNTYIKLFEDEAGASKE